MKSWNCFTAYSSDHRIFSIFSREGRTFLNSFGRILRCFQDNHDISSLIHASESLSWWACLKLAPLHGEEWQLYFEALPDVLTPLTLSERLNVISLQVVKVLFTTVNVNLLHYIFCFVCSSCFLSDHIVACSKISFVQYPLCLSSSVVLHPNLLVSPVL